MGVLVDDKLTSCSKEAILPLYSAPVRYICGAGSASGFSSTKRYECIEETPAQAHENDERTGTSVL